MNMSWGHSFEEKKQNKKGGVNMSIRIAEILYKLGLAVTHDADKHKIIIKRDK